MSKLGYCEDCEGDVEEVGPTCYYMTDDDGELELCDACMHARDIAAVSTW